MNKKGQREVGNIIEAGLSLLFLVIFVPIIISTLYSISHPEPQIVVNNTAVEEARNLSQQLTICETNYQELNKTIVTKQDLLDLASAIKQANQNIINIYESNQNYIQNYFSLTIALSISLGITLSFGLLTLFDWTVFKFELARGLFRAIKRRFKKDG